MLSFLNEFEKLCINHEEADKKVIIDVHHAYQQDHGHHIIIRSP